MPALAEVAPEPGTDLVGSRAARARRGLFRRVVDAFRGGGDDDDPPAPDAEPVADARADDAARPDRGRR